MNILFLVLLHINDYENKTAEARHLDGVISIQTLHLFENIVLFFSTAFSLSLQKRNNPAGNPTSESSDFVQNRFMHRNSEFCKKNYVTFPYELTRAF